MFYEISVLGNLAKFTRKHLRWSLFLIKLQGSSLQKQPPEVFYKKMFLKFRKIYIKTPVSESLFW